MILIGLTGGIGAGKSTVSAMLAQRGAVIIDGDAIVRELQLPGSPVLVKIVRRFGQGVLTDKGELDRAALANVVFSDSKALADLNEIVHPPLRVEIANRIDAERDTDRVVILDLPLLSENPRHDLAGIIVVDVEPEIARDRLVKFRGMSGSEVEARVASQASRDTRRSIADFIINNSFDLEHLQNEVERAWKWIANLPHSPKAAGGEVSP